ncbi:SDR family NAD(P)-dependent oxidoreductase [Natronomonas marina]|jgi:short-subunit dehydrogenase|uniref:SDR family NAD(P)-dependent oxidoreductase n=1 Tax=Natronomonas marina TaxID=2961939 RepID=UPI0020C9A5D5|nr:SDR family oxidoreductase [Natronomonas marina]
MTVDGTALITGASAGIGRALATEFAANGHDVALVARRETELLELANRLEDDHGVRAHAIDMDLASVDAPNELYETTEARDIQVDVLVNNVGIGTQGAFVENDLGRELDQMQLNVVTPTQLTHRYGGDMADRGHGGVLNVASTAAWFPGPFMAIYYASKAYMKNFSEGIAEELRPEGVDVTVLCPGPVDTEFQERADNEDTPLGSGEMQDVETVARAGYEGLQDGDTVVVTGWKYRLLTKVSNVLPNRLTRKSARDLNTAE